MIVALLATLQKEDKGKTGGVPAFQAIVPYCP